MTAVYVTLDDGTPCRVDTSEGEAWRLIYGERNGIGEERWVRMDLRSVEAHEAFCLAEALVEAPLHAPDAPDWSDDDAPLGERVVRIARAA